MCGAYDSPNYSERVLRALADVKFEGDVTVLLGAKAPHLKRVTKIKDTGKLTFGVEIVTNSVNTYSYISQADFVVGTGGQGLLERMALGVPSVTLVSSRNQIDQSHFMADRGATEIIDKEAVFGEELLPARLEKMLANDQKREQMSMRARSLIDGKGATRVATKILQLGSG